MSEQKFYITQVGYDELKKELDDLIHVQRPNVIIELQEARAQGDLSENADYDAARDRQARVEARIRDVEMMIQNAVIIESDEEHGGNTVGLGSTVTILDLEDNIEETYRIVGSIEADPLNGLLSNITPLAIALLDKRLGDTVLVEGVEVPYKVQIIGIK